MNTVDSNPKDKGFNRELLERMIDTSVGARMSALEAAIEATQSKMRSQLACEVSATALSSASLYASQLYRLRIIDTDEYTEYVALLKRIQTPGKDLVAVK